MLVDECWLFDSLTLILVLVNYFLTRERCEPYLMMVDKSVYQVVVV